VSPAEWLATFAAHPKIGAREGSEHAPVCTRTAVRDQHCRHVCSTLASLARPDLRMRRERRQPLRGRTLRPQVSAYDSISSMPSKGRALVMPRTHCSEAQHRLNRAAADSASQIFSAASRMRIARFVSVVAGFDGFHS